MVQLKLFIKLIIAIIFTIFTQIGGVLFLLNEWLWGKVNIDFRTSERLAKGFSFVVLYMLFTFLFVPHLAKIGGRRALPITQESNIKPLNFLTTLLNRNYVTKELYEVVFNVSNELDGVVVINYLDANFPFFDGFPLLPHLSHNDGKKLDLSFCYFDAETNKPSLAAPSFIGYGISENPKGSETHTAEFCSRKGYWQYGILNKLVPQSNKDHYIFDIDNTKLLIEAILVQKSVSKVFIEPHLVKRMNLNNSKIRFHGCHAVRHDDHIHFQVR